MTTLEIELKALMLASLDGNAASYRSLLDRLSRQLRAYYKAKLVIVGRGKVEAEDLVQEAILAIHLKRHTYDQREPLTPWVHAIARYKLTDFLRRNRVSFTEVPIDEVDEVMAHDDSADAESAYDIRRLMQRLPQGMQCSIQAVKLEGLRIAEAESRCGLSVTGAQGNVNSCIQEL